jgi:hypothetical protein
MNITWKPPVYGDGPNANYNIGYIGFSGVIGNPGPVSQGIAYFERWEKMSNISVSHALVVTGENECVEAIIGRGVARDPLDAYFNNPQARIFFRKPKGYTSDIGAAIAKVAQSQVGLKYDDILLGAFLLRGTFLGHWIEQLFGNQPAANVNDLMHTQHKWICSELAAYCMEEQPQYTNQGVLANHVDAIDPQDLFEDNVIFEPWNNQN